MRFAEPQWLVAGFVAVAFLVALLVRSEKLRSRAIRALEGARLRLRSFSPRRRWLRVGITASAIALGFVALARPQKGMHLETAQRRGTDLLLVVDTSKSMDADDVKPTRLERAKLSMRDLVERFPGDRIGLVAFAGDAFVQSPMTLDHDALLKSLDALDTSVISRGGTNVGRGIDVAAAALATEPGKQKVMVLLTDGEDLEGQGLAEAQRAAAAGITIDTVGVGTLAGELVPARDEHNRPVGVTRDEEGNPVRSHLDEKGLTAIAAAAHGTYEPLGADGRGLDRLYDASLAKLSQDSTSARTHRVYSERFEIPLALCLFGIVVDSLLGRRWRRAVSLRKRAPPAASGLVAAAAGLLLVLSAGSAHASVASGEKAYAAGHFEDAAKAFEAESTSHPSDPRLAFNAGAAAYRAGQFDASAADFKRAIATADPHLQQRAFYNQGDVLYRLGASKKPEERAETIAQWKAAIDAYEGALALDAKDDDARFNRDFVKRKVAALEQKDKEEPKKDDKKDDKADAPKKDGSNPKSGAEGSKPGEPKADANSKSGASNAPAPAPSTPGGQGAKPDTTPKAGSQGPTPSGSSGTPEPPHDGVPNAASEGAQPGQLSAHDARALLGALRGDERRGVTHGIDAGMSVDDSPRKDW